MRSLRVLFVDDEPLILSSLRRTLHRQRARWDMAFAPGGEAALAELAKAPFDVIVSDMRMPGMDGATLLRRVKGEYPGVARIVLSGYTDPEAHMRALPVAHQFLKKPCDVNELRAVIERAFQLQAVLEDDGIRRLVGALDALPSAPLTYRLLTRAIADPDADIRQIALIVETDPAMAVKVLQLVNSSCSGPSPPVTSIGEAVRALGIQLLKSVALTAHVFATLEAAPVEGFSLDRFQQHALRTARLARKLLPDPRRAEAAFTAALVHDVGKIVIALGLPDKSADIAAAAEQSGRSTHAVEKELLGVTHAEIGAYLLGVWGLPFPIVEAVAYHHSPSLIGEGPCDVLAALHVSDVLLDAAGAGERLPRLEDCDLDLAFLERAGFAAQLPRWHALAAGQSLDD